MTTNKTIDGVPRAAIEIMLSGKGGPAQAAAARELRDLLDATAENAQWVSVEAFNRVSTELEELKAAQPQAEPVAVVMPERDVEADHPTDPNEYALGWNAYLDEVKRLNK